VPLELRDRLIGTALPGCDRGQPRARQVLERPGQLRRYCGSPWRAFLSAAL